MQNSPNLALAIGGMCSAVLGAVHLSCVVIGPSCYRALGAGEQMANLAANGHWYPPAITIVIAGLLMVWSFYAFSGAGIWRRFPFARYVLALIASVYLIRGVAFKFLTPYFPDNSWEFWLWTSATAFTIGFIHLVGVVQVWKQHR